MLRPPSTPAQENCRCSCLPGLADRAIWRPEVLAMQRTVDVVIPVEPEVAEVLIDPRNREAVGRIVSRMSVWRPAATRCLRHAAAEGRGARPALERRDRGRRACRLQRRATRLIVFDASLLVGAAIKQDSVPIQAFGRALERDKIALSSAVEHEICEVLQRPRLARHILPELRAELLDQLRTRTARFDPTVHVTNCRDAKDNKYLELALASGRR
jgi:predicted nucleic acid-binding protein